MPYKDPEKAKAAARTASLAYYYRQKEKKDEGQCSSCFKELDDPLFKKCSSCRAYMREHHRAHRGPKARSLCSRVDCKRKAVVGFFSCALCRSRERVREFPNRRALRLAVFAAYGGPACACCGEDGYEFLTIDHEGGTGAAHRRQNKSALDIYRWLSRSGYPAGFRVLCFNCNCALGMHGYCPHRGWTQPRTRPLPVVAAII